MTEMTPIASLSVPRQSRASFGWQKLPMMELTLLSIAALLPYTPAGSLLGFTPLPVSLLGTILFLAATYLLLVQAAKSWFYRRHALL